MVCYFGHIDVGDINTLFYSYDLILTSKSNKNPIFFNETIRRYPLYDTYREIKIQNSIS
jgi:hypothetical protein